MSSLQNFDKKSFLSQGAIYGSGDQFWLFSGDFSKSESRPLGPSVLVADFFLDKEFLWWSFDQVIQTSLQDIQKVFEKKETCLDFQGASKQNFKKQFDFIQDEFELGALEKAVPYVFESFNKKTEPFEVESFLAHALTHRQGYIYGAWDGDSGILGLTPEILITQEKSKMQTMALAGTCLLEEFNKNPQSFLTDSKEINEHEIVVQDLKETLAPLGSLTVSQRQVEKTPTLVHFKTEIDWDMGPNFDLNKVIDLLHPTPALGCSPRAKALEVMAAFAEWEPRGRFGAPFGFSESTTKAQVVVAIRNLIWKGECLKVGSGCGVVKESQLEKEWSELKNKRNSVKKIFGLL